MKLIHLLVVIPLLVSLRIVLSMSACSVPAQIVEKDFTIKVQGASNNLHDPVIQTDSTLKFSWWTAMRSEDYDSVILCYAPSRMKVEILYHKESILFIDEYFLQDCRKTKDSDYSRKILRYTCQEKEWWLEFTFENGEFISFYEEQRRDGELIGRNVFYPF